MLRDFKCSKKNWIKVSIGKSAYDGDFNIDVESTWNYSSNNGNDCVFNQAFKLVAYSQRIDERSVW